MTDGSKALAALGNHARALSDHLSKWERDIARVQATGRPLSEWPDIRLDLTSTQTWRRREASPFAALKLGKQGVDALKMLAAECGARIVPQPASLGTERVKPFDPSSPSWKNLPGTFERRREHMADQLWDLFCAAISLRDGDERLASAPPELEAALQILPRLDDIRRRCAVLGAGMADVAHCRKLRGERASLTKDCEILRRMLRDYSTMLAEKEARIVEIDEALHSSSGRAA